MISADTRTDAGLGELVDAISNRLQAGERPSLARLQAEHPEHASELAELWPVLRELANASEPPVAPTQRQLGDFRLLREIGRGGMGVVYEAEQVSLGRRVAVKTLPFAEGLHRRQIRRFQHEARAAAALHHPHIVPVFGVGCEGGVHYFAMQYVEGQSLAQWVAEERETTGLDNFALSDAPTHPEPATPRSADTRRPASSRTRASHAPDPADRFRQAAEWIAQAADALEYAHGNGVVHRDIKPANLLVDGRGHLWVADFGLVRIGADAGLTRTGELVGTLRYMSPEQASAKHDLVDHRADVYGLGATLYELLTLQAACDAEERAELFRQIDRGEPIPPSRLVAGLPSSLEVIALKALAHDLPDRYATAGELADDLRRFLDGVPIRAKPAAWPERLRRGIGRRWRETLAVGAVLLALVSVLVVGQLRVAQQRDRAIASTQRYRQVVDEWYSAFAEEWIARQPHLEAKQRDQLRTAMAHYQTLLAEDAPTPELRVQAARTRRRIGDIEAKLGDVSAAEAAYADATRQLEGLDARPDAMVERGRALTHAGNLLRLSQRPNAAETKYSRAIESYGLALADAPGDVDARRGRAGCWSSLATLRHAAGDPANAITLSRQALSEWAALGETGVSALALLHERASCGNNLGLLLTEAGDQTGAERAFADALRDWDQLRAAAPESPAHRHGAATATENVALLRAVAGRVGEAATVQSRAVAERRWLTEQYPHVPAYRLDAVRSQIRFGQYATRAGRLTEAETALRDAYAKGSAFALPGADEELGRCHHALGELLRAKSNQGAAEQAFRAAIALRERLWAAMPASVALRFELAQSLADLSALVNDQLERERLAERATRLLADAPATAQQLPAWTSLKRSLEPPRD